jgi:cytochrome c biogenesis protein CcdA
MDLIFAYLAGVLTLINPCVLPVLPIVLATSLQADRRAPIALAAGMGLSFVALGLGVAALGPVLGITEDTVARAASAR